MTNERPSSVTLPAAAIEALRQGNKIEAIKLVRLERDIGLKDSKDAVEAYLRTHPALQHQLQAAQAQSTQRLLRWLAVVMVLAAAGAYLVLARP